MIRIVAVLALFAASIFAGPAAAQYGGSYGGPPRPPADVPNGAFPPQPPPPGYGQQQYQQPQYQPQYPAQQQGGYGQPPQYTPQPSAGPPPSGVQAQPLPPPPGASAAPPPAQRARAAPQPAGPPGPAAQPSSPPQQANNPPPPPPPDVMVKPDDTIVTEMPTQKIANSRAVFSGLDKITGRIISFDAAIGETVQFGALQVTARVCYTRPPTEATNTDAFVEVDEVTLKGEIKRIFTGWMFAASPGLHAVEHPIYDVWLTDCSTPSAPSPVAQSTPTPVPAATPPAGQKGARPAAPTAAPQPRRPAIAPIAPSAPPPVTDD
jgi:hypothetical protein